MSKLNEKIEDFQVGDVVVKLSESKEVYFQVIDIVEGRIKIKAINLPLYTYVRPKEITSAALKSRS